MKKINNIDLREYDMIDATEAAALMLREETGEDFLNKMNKVGV